MVAVNATLKVSVSLWACSELEFRWFCYVNRSPGSKEPKQHLRSTETKTKEPRKIMDGINNITGDTRRQGGEANKAGYEDLWEIPLRGPDNSDCK